ncbi:MAG TPA: CoA transferase [Kineosporiaceae bacterium]
MSQLGGVLEVESRPVDLADVDEVTAWASSGAADLAGFPDGPPLPAPGSPASTTLAALAVAQAYLGVGLPGVELLGERAALSAFRRNAPFSPGGAFRCLPARDGWLGLSLGRHHDREVLPALIEARIAGDPWQAVGDWLRGVDVAVAHARAIELQLAVAAVPALPSEPAEVSRPPVEVHLGGPRRWRSSPLVVDLTALWAGPLAARLLGLAGARVVKVESKARLDGTRFGNPAFFDVLHRGHDVVQLDFTADRSTLLALLASADVVLEASRPRALTRLGIDAAEYVANGTVWASITAYGRRGPGADRVGFGDDVAVEAGLHAWTPEGPVTVGDAIADPLAGVHAAAAVSMALQASRGCLLDVSMHHVARSAVAPSPG